MDPSSKQFMDGFLQYLQSYYGAAFKPTASSQQPHVPRMPIFQSQPKVTEQPIFPPGNMGMQPGMGMGMGSGMDIAGELNNLFPQPSPYGMN